MAAEVPSKREREEEGGDGTAFKSSKADPGGAAEDKQHPMVALLEECGQEEILASVAEADREELYAQVAALDRNYPTGLRGYVDNARALLAASSSGANPMADVVRVEVPTGKNLVFGSDEYAAFEALGAAEISRVCFVLVAGGPGDRLRPLDGRAPSAKSNVSAERRSGSFSLTLSYTYLASRPPGWSRPTDCGARLGPPSMGCRCGQSCVRMA